MHMYHVDTEVLGTPRKVEDSLFEFGLRGLLWNGILSPIMTTLYIALPNIPANLGYFYFGRGHWSGFVFAAYLWWLASNGWMIVSLFTAITLSYFWSALRTLNLMM